MLINNNIITSWQLLFHILKPSRLLYGPVKTVLQEICKSCKFFLARFCKSCTKNEAFLARYKRSCKNLARKNCKIVFLQDLIKLLQENYLVKFSCKILARVFVSCKKSFILVQDLQDLVLDLASLTRKILVRFGYLLQDGFYWVRSGSYRASSYAPVYQ